METNYKLYQLNTSFSVFSNYCYIIADKITKQACIVDPAWELDKILDVICKLELNLTTILLTHSHYDHVNLVNPLIKRFNSNVYMSKNEIDYYKFSCKNLISANHMDELKIGEMVIKCLLTPGHTEGGMCYLTSDSIFTGDTIFIEGCGICSSDGGSAAKMFDSIQMIRNFVLKDVHVYPAHSYGKQPGYTLSYLEEKNIYFQIEKKEHFINFRMRKNEKIFLNLKNTITELDKQRLNEL
ncbi:MBL fold metallo-hydrolase [Clostridium beijerinckii]|uniref:Glyoxylase-like metal-dependent hydrolase (Beta-lactamase superfamily II) n=1 Tax=Clostridium beijerinckii TaxID=1520 RepID=A0AAE5H4D1_CLOBE|nr:MBL fold metallo-hydrolase [Clostridium beijerinckii]ALB45644.1 beta-lactamase domain protein [Clostridium beijerinckii NRRL B-598]NSB14150.1 glyoxylase-like metal-dependent hydrolase (beta-lactamase superfamily II) [Clostridium beijerinckii]OOM30502.1 putative polyketide biosynthesis zinc-dependent hydrolase PksB [Clostridium beijerinckii]